MDSALRAVTRPVRPAWARIGWWLPAGAFLLPLVAALWWGVAQGLDAVSWTVLLRDSQFLPAWALSGWVGVASTVLATALALGIVTALHGSGRWQRVQASLGALLALPHAAFAIGLALLLMPSGWPARVVALWAGWTEPPDVATVQDPLGLALIAGLVLKELPFLLWNVAAQLQRAGQGAELTKQLQIAGTMGYARRTAWQRVLWPQLLPRLALPLLAVWAYSLTVVDMALVLGPTQPPTLSVLAWHWLLDADTAVNRQGAAAALLLAASTAAGAIGAALAWRLLRPAMSRRWTRGDRPTPASRLGVVWPRVIGALYAAVGAMLLLASVSGVWTFPALWPQQLTADAWIAVISSAPAIGLTFALALVSAATGMVLAVAWMETTPAHWDTRAAALVFAPMLIPGVLLVSGLYQLALHAGIDGSFAGLWLAHSLYVAPYVLVSLAPAYRGLDRRYEQTAHALGRSHAGTLWHIKWPMLSVPLAASFAVGFAVSVTQYLPTQFVGAGRHATVTTEALTLAASGARSAAAAFSLLQAMLPAAMFALAWWVGRRQAARLA
ncbi:ABC transporter permease subunit [Piscinibacter sp. XHJ-5]|uniref:ABC transporter permease n=1 Tax=Piscinibacter sp. XHJ-5 TaxID=3037797 RepID=UPI0024532AE9|nr:ABC transporter permease subunit [Piscinibacter sp. XHJ-5]